MVTISIIIPVYNAKEYIRQSVESVLNQTFSDIELLLVDDGSVDGSEEICDEYSSIYNNVRTIHKKNEGVSSARNKGIENASGKYLMFLDSDDYMKPDMCEIMYSHIVSKESDIVICGTEETGGGLWRPEENIDYDYPGLVKSYINLNHPALLAPPWNKIYKRALISVPFDESTSFGEDLIFNLNYLSVCKRISFVVDCPMFHTKDNPSSLSSTVYPKRLKEIEHCFSSLITFCKGYHSADVLSSKYLSDIVVYSRKLLSNKSLTFREKVETLSMWHKESAVRSLNVFVHNNICFKNKLLLAELKYGLWWISYVHVMKKLF